MIDALDRLRSMYPWPEEKPKVSERAIRIPGWGQPEALFEESLSDRTRLVVELGSWLGQSSRFILDRAPNATIICVDHWNGSPEHVERESDVLSTLYDAFLSLCWELRDRIIPIRATTSGGLKIIASFGLTPDLIYVDASHDYDDVKADIDLSHRLFPTSTLIGDDYANFVDVRRAVAHFVRDNNRIVRVIGRGWKLI